MNNLRDELLGDTLNDLFVNHLNSNLSILLLLDLFQGALNNIQYNVIGVAIVLGTQYNTVHEELIDDLIGYLVEGDVSGLFLPSKLERRRLNNHVVFLFGEMFIRFINRYLSVLKVATGRSSARI